jgi:Trk K+ transport system NAD-binding subunit
MLRDKIIESRFSSYLIESKDLGVIELEVKNSLVGKTIQDINIPGEFIVVAIRRMHGVMLPEAGTVLKDKDILMGLVKVASLRQVRDQFHLDGK